MSQREALPVVTTMPEHWRIWSGTPLPDCPLEGFMIEALIARAPRGTTAHFYRTAADAEIDLLLTLPGNRQWAIGIKHSLAPKVEKGFHLVCADLEPHRACVVYPGKERFPLSADIQAVGLDEAITGLRAKG